MTTFPQNLTVTAGDDAELICGATFDSRLHLDWSWTQDGKIVVQHGEHYVVNGEVLMVNIYILIKVLYVHFIHKYLF